MPRILKLGVLAVLAVHLFSCAPSKQYYLLTPEGPAPSGGGRGIGVGPVSVAAYLDRPNLVFHENGNRLAVAESHRWAGDLEDNIASVLAANLGRTYTSRIYERVQQTIESEPALPEPELEHLFRVMRAFDDVSFELPADARRLKIAVVRRLVDLYYEGYPASDKEKIVAELEALAAD